MFNFSKKDGFEERSTADVTLEMTGEPDTGKTAPTGKNNGRKSLGGGMNVISAGFNEVRSSVSSATKTLVHLGQNEAGSDFMDNIDFESRFESRVSINQVDELTEMSEEEMVAHLKAGDFSTTALPTAHAVIASCMIAPQDGNVDFVEGMWVERLGPDMTWHLDRVTTVHKIMEDNVDWSELKEGEDAPWTAFYDFHSQKMLNKAKLRHPEEGLKRVFGCNPWIWQQYAVLKVEEQIRFQQNHFKDFDKIDIDMLAKSEWDVFVNHEGNEDLKARIEDPRFHNAQKALLHHILSPFRVMEGLRNAGTEKENPGFATDWDMSDERLSAYTYLGVLGSGWLVPLLCVFVQFSAPLLLGSYALDNSSRKDSGWCDDSETWSDDKIKGKFMIFTVVILYLSKIVPDAVFNFLRSVGEGTDAHSKVMALRKLIWDRGEDFNLGQMVGYKLDLYMNTSYVCLLYTLNLFILFTTDDVIEMMLNAMAVEFVLKMDEEFAATDWWDPDKRWIRAGALELTIGSTLRKSHLSSAVKFEKHYHVSLGALTKALGEDAVVNGFLLQDKELAAKDSVNSIYLSPEDAVNLKLAKIAKKNNLDDQQFVKPVVSFGILSKIIHYIAPEQAPNTLFNRYSDLYCWSRWHKIMYSGLASIPSVESIYASEDNKKISPNDHLLTQEKRDTVSFANYSRNVERKAVKYILSILTGVEILRGPALFMKRGEFFKVLYRTADGVVMWFNVVVQVAFPLFILLSAVAVPSCY